MNNDCVQELNEAVVEQRVRESFHVPVLEDGEDWSALSDGSVHAELSAIHSKVLAHDEVGLHRELFYLSERFREKNSQIPDEYLSGVVESGILEALHGIVDSGVSSLYETVICFISDLGHICKSFTQACFESGLVRKLCDYYGDQPSLPLIALVNNSMDDYQEVSPIVYGCGWLSMLSEKLKSERDPSLVLAMTSCFAMFFRSLPQDVNLTDCRVYLSNILAIESSIAPTNEWRTHCLRCFRGFARHQHGIAIMFQISVLTTLFNWMSPDDDTPIPTTYMKLLLLFIQSPCPGVANIFYEHVSVIIRCIRYGYPKTRLFGARVLATLIPKATETVDVCLHDGYISILTLHLPDMSYDEKEASIFAFCTMLKYSSTTAARTLFIKESIVDAMIDILSITTSSSTAAMIRESLYTIYTLDQDSNVHEMIRQLFLDGTLPDMPLSLSFKI